MGSSDCGHKLPASEVSESVLSIMNRSGGEIVSLIGEWGSSGVAKSGIWVGNASDPSHVGGSGTELVELKMDEFLDSRVEAVVEVDVVDEKDNDGGRIAGGDWDMNMLDALGSNVSLCGPMGYVLMIC